MQAKDISEDKLEQNEDLAKLRAGVSLAKSGSSVCCRRNRRLVRKKHDKIK